MVFPKEQIKSTWKESFVEVGENKYYRGDEVSKIIKNPCKPYMLKKLYVHVRQA